MKDQMNRLGAFAAIPFDLYRVFCPAQSEDSTDTIVTNRASKRCCQAFSVSRRRSLWQVLSLLVFFWLTPTQAFAQTVVDFASGVYVEHPRLSPDGRRYAMVLFSGNTGPYISVHNRKTHERVQKIVGFKGVEVDWIDFASDETLLASISTPFRIEGNRFYWPTSRVISLGIGVERTPVVLFENNERMLSSTLRLNRIVDALPTAPERVIMGAYNKRRYDLFQVNVLSGDAARIAKGGELTVAWFTGADGLPSIRMDCANRRCRRIKAFRPDRGDEPYTSETKWVQFRTFERGNPNEETLLNLQPVGPTGNPDEFFVLDGRDDVPRRAVRRYNIRTDSFVETVYEDVDYDVSGVIIDPVTREYRGAQIWRDRVDYVFADETLQSHLDGINRFFNDDWNVTIQEIARDRSAALIFASASDELGAYYTYDFETRQTQKIRSINPNLHNAIATKTERIDLPMRDGTTITGYLTVPDATTDRGLVILVHGGPEARDVMDYDRDVQFLGSRGYKVLRVNFRGSSGYGRDFARAGYRQWGGVMHTDLVDATQHMHQQGHAKPETTCIMGHSYGGYAALLAGALEPELFTCIVAGSGPSDLNQALKDERKDHGASSRQLAYWEKVIGDRRKDKKQLAAISPRRLVAQYDDPILLLHGAWDWIVDVEHSRKMEKALEKAGKDVEYVELRGGHSHANWSTKTRRKYLYALETFLEVNLNTQNPENSTIVEATAAQP